jgi:ribonucleoside-diphosphate reductase alpha chain
MNTLEPYRVIKLPPVRPSVTHKFRVGGCEAYMIIGLTEQGQPAELFVKISKQGSTLSGLVDSFCRALSMALQYGLPLEKVISKFEGMRFEPSGATTNPKIPTADSLVDYIARYLRMNWGTA